MDNARGEDTSISSNMNSEEAYSDERAPEGRREREKGDLMLKKSSGGI